MTGGTETVAFSEPPVVEVVAGVALGGTSPEVAPLLAAFWKEQLRDAFPVIQQQPPYSPPVEQFLPEDRGPRVMFSLGFAPPWTRIWAQSQDGQHLLQLQPDYFACNWRKVQPHDEYDRWSTRRAEFQKWLDALSGYLVAAGAGEPKITQCEVTYINHIRAGRGWRDHSDFARIFDVVRPTSVPHSLEQVTAQVQFVLEEDGAPYGRLHAKILPGFAQDGKTPIYVLELTARGQPIGDGVNGAVAFLDRGREAVDRMFVALTTDEMHEEWGMQGG